MPLSEHPIDKAMREIFAVINKGREAQRKRKAKSSNPASGVPREGQAARRSPRGKERK